jgi:phosphate starvation-inducible protein PhoH
MGKNNNKNKKFKEEDEFKKLMSVDNNTALDLIKQEIEKYIPNNITVKAKNDKQKKLINSIRNNEITICAGPAGTGKAQPLDSKILSKNGYVEMRDIKISDEIFTMNGNLTKVIGVYPQGYKDIYRITFNDDSEVESCGEHLWLIKTTDDRWNNKNFRVKSLNEIKNNFILKNNRKNYSIPITKPVQFYEKSVDIDPYVMGVLIGDATFVAPNIRLTTNDDEIVNEVKDNLSENYQIKKVLSSKYDYSITMKYKLYGKSFKNLVSKYKLNNHKSDEKFIPNEYKFNSIENRIKLLQGLLDSDGTIENKSRSISFTTTSKKLIDDFKFLVESLGGVVNKLRIKENNYKKNDLKIKTGIVSYTYSFRLPNEIKPFKLKRKLNLFKEKIKYFPIRYIKNIEYIGKKEAKCIMVDDKTQTYLTNHFVVTHNTYVSVAYALALLRKLQNNYKKIYLVKSVTALKGEEVGFLKGDWKEKIEPFMWSYFINMEKIVPKNTITQLVDNDIIRPFPLAYMRGASLDDCIIIADEMQNVSLDNARTLLTRIGNNCKLILLGDINQIDMKNKEESSLEKLLHLFYDIEKFGVINMGMEDTNVRNPLITTIEEKFEEYNESNGK